MSEHTGELTYITTAILEPDGKRPFSAAILDCVSDVAARQNSLSFEELWQRVPPVQKYNPGYGRPTIEVLDIGPRDAENIVVLHSPMAGSLNPDRVLRAYTVATTMPDTRLITVGNPGELRHGTGKLHMSQIPAVYRGDLRPTIESTLLYLRDNKIESSDHVGISFGADKAAAAASFMYNFDQQFNKLVVIDPASVIARKYHELALAFRSARDPIKGYVEATGCPAYIEARARSSGSTSYTLGLLRASNWAITHALKRGGFEERLQVALKRHPHMAASLIWAEGSELCIHETMTDISTRAKEKYGQDRVATTALANQHHAMGNNIYLLSAMVLHGLGVKAA